MELREAVAAYLIHISFPHQQRESNHPVTYLQRPGLDDAMIDDVEEGLAPFLQFAEARGLAAEALHVNTVEDWLDALKISQGERLGHGGKVKLFLEYLAEQGVVPETSLTPQLNHPHEYLPKEQRYTFAKAAQRIYKGASDYGPHPRYLAVLLPVLLDTHLHIEALLTIRAEDVSLRRGLYFWEADGSRVTVTVQPPFTFNFLDILRWYLDEVRTPLAPESPLLFLEDDGKPVAVEQVVSHLNTLAAQLGCNPITAHTFRDSHITRLAKLVGIRRSDFNPRLPTCEVHAYRAAANHLLFSTPLL